MKKEIGIWINKNWEQNKNSFTNFREQGGRCAEYTQRATLIIDVPEPKIEITPSELLKAMQITGGFGWSQFHSDVVKTLFPDYEGNND